jgi:MFS family permease
VSCLRFIVSRACSSLADQTLAFAVPLIVYTSTRNVSLAGLALFIEWLPRIISLPIAGGIVDRVGGYRVYGVADGVRAAACCIAVGFALAFPHAVFPIVGALVAVTALFYAQAFIALEATVPLIASSEEMPRAQALVQSVDQGAAIMGPACAASAVLFLPPIFLPLGASALFAFSAMLVWSLRGALREAHESIERPPRRDVRSEVFAGAAVLRAHPFLLSLVSLSFAVNLIIGISLAVGAALTVGRFGLSNAHYGIVQGSVGVFSLLSFAIVPKLTARYSLFRIGMGAYALIVLGALTMGTAGSFPLFVLGFALAYGSCGLFNVYIRTERVRCIPREHLGRAIGVIVLLNQASLPLSGLLVAAAASHMNVQRLFLLAALIAMAIQALLFTSLRYRSKITQASGAPTALAAVS